MGSLKFGFRVFIGFHIVSSTSKYPSPMKPFHSLPFWFLNESYSYFMKLLTPLFHHSPTPIGSLKSLTFIRLSIVLALIYETTHFICSSQLWFNWLPPNLDNLEGLPWFRHLFYETTHFLCFTTTYSLLGSLSNFNEFVRFSMVPVFV